MNRERLEADAMIRILTTILFAWVLWSQTTHWTRHAIDQGNGSYIPYGSGTIGKWIPEDEYQTKAECEGEKKQRQWQQEQRQQEGCRDATIDSSATQQEHSHDQERISNRRQPLQVS